MTARNTISPQIAVVLAAVLLTLLVLGWWSIESRLQDTAAYSAATTGPDRPLQAAPAAVEPEEVIPAKLPAADEGQGSGLDGAAPHLLPPDQNLQIASPPDYIAYAAVGMNQAVLPLTPTEEEIRLGSIVPPQTADVYWLSSYGTPGRGSDNTTYLVGHSWEGRSSPFNNISARARPGDQLTLTTGDGPQTYVIDTVTTEDKDTLKDSPIWLKVPHRLIIITCFTADIWETNIIIQASPLQSG